MQVHRNNSRSLDEQSVTDGSVLVADIGGTNIRFGLLEHSKTGAPVIKRISKYKCAEFPTIEDAIQIYLDSHPDCRVIECCLGVAGIIGDDIIDITNNHWQFSKQALIQQFGLLRLEVINDYTAIAFSLLWLDVNDMQQLGAGSVIAGKPKVVFGPGTGLGVEYLLPASEGRWTSLAGEGGHIDFASTTPELAVVSRYVKSKLGRCSAEEILSGRGIVNIYLGLCQHHSVTPQFDQPQDIVVAALEQTDSLAKAVLEQFCIALGSFAGNLALSVFTEGGVFISGGIVPRFTEFLAKSKFRDSFERKHPMVDKLKQIPVFVITDPHHPLLGCAVYLAQTGASLALESNEGIF